RITERSKRRVDCVGRASDVRQMELEEILLVGPVEETDARFLQIAPVEDAFDGKSVAVETAALVVHHIEEARIGRLAAGRPDRRSKRQAFRRDFMGVTPSEPD